MTAVPAARGRLDYLKMVPRQLYYEQLNFWLNPIAALFTVVFSLVFLVLLGSSAGSSTSDTLGGVKVIQYYVPGFVSYGVMSTCFNSLATSLVIRRESGLLKRVRLSPLPSWAMIAAICLNALIISAVQIIVLLVVGRVAYGVHLPHAVLALVVDLLVGVVCFTAVGVAVSTLIPNQEAAGPVVSIVFFVLLFLSGLWYPIQAHSALARISSFFPVRHMIVAVYAPFDPRRGSAWAWGDLGAMAVWAAVAVAVALRRWSWAPSRSGPAGHTSLLSRNRGV
jgi:ABC-2 type transport system permease protein